MVRAGKWDFWSPAFMVGWQATGKRFGVLGMGRVGQVAADRARSFRMEVHYHSRHALPDDLATRATYRASVESPLAEHPYRIPEPRRTPVMINRLAATLAFLMLVAFPGILLWVVPRL